MSTTIQVSEITRQLLASLQRKSKKSYDQIIQEMLAVFVKSPDTLAGEFPQLRWNKKDRIRFNEE